MALSDLEVLQEEAYGTMMELLPYRTNLFNEATNGGLILIPSSHQGDFDTVTFWKRIQDLVRRRNPYADEAIAQRSLAMDKETGVKVGAGTYEVRLDQAWLDWIQRDPSEAGAVLGANLAEQTMDDMVNNAIGCYIAATSNQSAQLWKTAASTSTTLMDLMKAASLMGDRANQIGAWVMHSAIAFQIYGQAIQNNERLFSFGNLQVVSDGFGRPLIMFDHPALVDDTRYRTLGMTPGAVRVEQNDDFRQAMDTRTGRTNIVDTYQAEWSYNMYVKGYSWDTAAGGKAPTNAALQTATNWDKVYDSIKDLAGVVLETETATP